VHLLFVDESGQPDQPGLFALGGVAVRDRDWHELRDAWQGVLRRHRWPLEREVKWHGIRSGEVPPALADAVFAALAGAPLTGYVTLLDCRLGREDERFQAFFATPEETYSTGLMFLAERFQKLLEAEEDVGAIVVDSRHREGDSRLRRFYAELTEEGSPYSRLDSLVEGLFLGPSHYSIGLQCADLVVAATAAAERGGGDARRYLAQMLPRFARHPATGALDGVGLKRFPEQVQRPREETRLFDP
jgi:hypothetical protein